MIKEINDTIVPKIKEVTTATPLNIQVIKTKIKRAQTPFSKLIIKILNILFSPFLIYMIYNTFNMLN